MLKVWMGVEWRVCLVSLCLVFCAACVGGTVPEDENNGSNQDGGMDAFDVVDTRVDDSSAEDASTEDASAEDTSAEDTSAEDTSAEDTSAEDTSADAEGDSGRDVEQDTGPDVQEDAGPDVEEDTGPDCPNEPCTQGESQCTSDSVARGCVRGSDGCLTWGTPASCGGSVCENGQCQNCEDDDGDGYGENCGAGADCDDTNPDVYDLAPELCDGIDNNCNGAVDETYGQLGQSCTVTQNGCSGSGTYVCNGSGNGVECDGTVPTSPETCDGADNDCDGQVDEDYGNLGVSCQNGSGVCAATGAIACDPNDQWSTYCDAGPANTQLAVRETCDNQDNDCDGQIDENACNACVEDAYEDNDSSLAGTDLTSSGSVSAVTLCGNLGTDLDRDWFRMGTSAAGASVQVSYPNGSNAVGASYPDLNIDIFCDSTYCGTVTGTGGNLEGTIPDCGTCNYAFYVYNSGTNPASGTPYDVTRP